jgi:cation transport ATPase
MLSHRPEREAAAAAAALGIADYRTGLSDADKAAFLRDRRSRGVHTAFVGDCRGRTALAAAATIAVSTSGEADREADPAHVVLLRPDLDRFVHVLEVARAHAGRVESAQRFVLVPNALCVAGAFFFGVPAFTVALVTNLTTFGLYRRASDSLRSPPTRGPERPLRRLEPIPTAT